MNKTYSLNNYHTTSLSSKFACQSCGECCRGWAIYIDEKTYQDLSKYFNKYPLPYTNQQLFIIEEKDGKKTITNNMINNQCIFLEDNNLCYIHRVIGKEAKSEICTTYPQKFSATPRGLFNTLSFSCLAAAKLLNYKKLFKVELFSHSLPIDPAKELDYHEDKKLSWSLYFLIETHLMNLIEKENYIFEERIIMGSFLLWNIYENFIKVGNKNYKDIKESLERLKANNYQSIFQSLKKTRSSAHIQLKFLFILLKRRLDLSKIQLVGNNKSFDDFIGLVYNRFNLKNDLSNFNSKCAIEYLRAYRNDYQIHINNFDHVFKNYFLHKIFGKNLFTGYGIIKGYHIILTLYALMRFYCMLFWSDNFNYEDIFKSISLIERLYVHSPGTLEFWKNVDEIEVMHKPIFAYTLIHL
ncbi:MAG: flagellin lysine-N-methylase [bacterium]|nr:flagellin lysine-N-methylase [bacterium]